MPSSRSQPDRPIDCDSDLWALYIVGLVAFVGATALAEEIY
jgi:hypothetical protein